MRSYTLIQIHWQWELNLSWNYVRNLVPPFAMIIILQLLLEFKFWKAREVLRKFLDCSNCWNPGCLKFFEGILRSSPINFWEAGHKLVYWSSGICSTFIFRCYFFSLLLAVLLQWKKAIRTSPVWAIHFLPCNQQISGNGEREGAYWEVKFFW